MELPECQETRNDGIDADETVLRPDTKPGLLTGQSDRDSTKVVFARHRLLGQLGAGGMGFVCLAEHIELGALRAIKFLATHRVEDAEAIQRFQREWRSIGQIEHPHLARAFDCGQESGIYFLVLEYIDGVTLSEVVRHKQTLSVAQVATIGIQVLSGLGALHAGGFVHRDIKPSNIVLGRDGVVRVIDFGLACLHDELREDDELTGTHQFVGSPAWMPPEQFQKSQATDARNDLYSLGCTLFTLVTGELPYPTAGKTIWQIATDHASPDVPNVRDHRPEIEAAFAALIQDLMQPDSAQRPDESADVLARLAPFATDEDLSAIVNIPAPTLEPVPDGLLTRLARNPVAKLDSATTMIYARSESVDDPKQDRTQRAETILTGPAKSSIDASSDRNMAWAIVSLVLLVCIVVVALTRQQTHGEPDKPTQGSIADTGNSTAANPTETGSTTTGSTTSISRATSASVFPPRQLPQLVPVPDNGQLGEPMGPAAITRAPRQVAGISSWTWETRSARGWISAIRTSFDGSRVAIGSNDGSLRIYELPDLTVKRMLAGHASVDSIRWLTDSTLIAADEGGSVRIWDVDDGQVLRQWKVAESPTSDADISYDGQWLAIAGVGKGCLIRSVVNTNKTVDRLPRTGQAYAVAWSPTKLILAESNERFFRLYAVTASGGETPETVETHSRELSHRIQSVEWNADGKHVAVVPGRGTVCQIIEAPSGKTVAEVSSDSSPVQMCRWSPNAQQLAVLTRSSLLVVNRAGELQSETSLTSGNLVTFDWTSNESILASQQYGKGLLQIHLGKSSSTNLACQHYCRSTFIRRAAAGIVVASGEGLFQIKDGTITPFPRLPSERDNRVWGLGVTGDDQPAIIAAGSQSLNVTTAPDGEWKDLAGPKIKPVDVCCHPKRPRAAVLYQNGEVWLWTRSKPVELHRKLPDVNFHSQIAWSPDGKLLAVGARDRLTIWNPDDPDDADAFEWQIPEGGNVAAWSPDSSHIATTSVDSVRVFSIANHDPVARLKGQTHYYTRGIDWSPDGTQIAAMTESFLRIWDTKTWTPKRVISVNVALSGCVPLAWSQSGESVYIAGSDAVLREFDAATGECVGVALLINEGRYAAFNSDGTMRQAVGLDHELLIITNSKTGQQHLRPDEIDLLGN